VTEVNHWNCWGLRKKDGAYVYDEDFRYGELGIVYGRMVDGVVIPV